MVSKNYLPFPECAPSMHAAHQAPEALVSRRAPYYPDQCARSRLIWNTAAEINTNTDGAIWLASGRCSLPRCYQAFHRACLRDSQLSDAAVSRIPPVSSPLAVGLARLP